MALGPNLLDQVAEQQLLVVDDLLRLGVGSGLASVAGVGSLAKDPVVGHGRTEDTGVVHVEGIEACRLDRGCRRKVSMG